MAFQGSLKELPLPDIIQLVSVSGKTGAFQLTNGNEKGAIYLADGQIVHATVGDLEGEEAVYDLAIWPQGDFVFTPGEAASHTSVQKSNTNLLMEAARRIDEWQILSKRIPSTRLVPVFTANSSNSSVSFTPKEWSLIRRVDERRSIDEIAVGLGLSPFEACKTLYGLITSGLIELKEDLRRLDTERLRTMTPQQLRQLAQGIHEQARELLQNHPRQSELDGAYRQSAVEVDADRGADAILDLVRDEEKILSAALGPNQAKTFLNRVHSLLGAS